ncbi:Nucleoporin Nup120/160 [Abortiporus biennis]
MSDWALFATQISSLYSPSLANNIIVRTIQTSTPLPPPPSETDLPLEHATYSNIFSIPPFGTILLRLVHGGLVLELLSLSHDIPPLRIIFPSTVLSYPSIFAWGSHELHVLAMTNNASLFRVVIPLRSDGRLWDNISNSDDLWNEQIIHRLKPSINNTLIHVADGHTVYATMPDGWLLRLEARNVELDNEEQWIERTLHHGSLLSSFTSLLHSHESNGTDIISIATLQEPTELGSVWTLSRDRTLRLWSQDSCIYSTTYPGPTILTSGSVASGSKVPLLDAQPQRLLKVFTLRSSDLDMEFVVLFAPNDTSLLSGGCFYLIALDGNKTVWTKSLEAPERTARCYLQDFILDDQNLFTLWDSQGQSLVQFVNVGSDIPDTERRWSEATYPDEVELTPAYLDELLLSPGSLVDRFLEAILRPGMFSPLTLSTALNQYISACLSLPGGHHDRPAQLLASYPTVAENIAAVVGCTVKLSRDPHTGAAQYDNYWNALKRDWEGFIARCREVERSGRWPLALGVSSLAGGVLVIERERIGIVAVEDAPLRLHHHLRNSSTVEDATYSLLEILWTLREKIGQRSILSLESRLIEIVHQEIAFPYADIIQDQAQRSAFREELDEGLDSWITGRLQSIEDIQTATRLVVDLIGACDTAVKNEEDEEINLLSQSSLEWKKALVSSYATSTIQARYDICVSLVTLLFFLSEDLSFWDPSLLAEIFAVFRGVAILRYTSRQPAGFSNAQETRVDDDVVTRMRNMNVTSGREGFSPSCSVIHRLLHHVSEQSTIALAASQFLDYTGLLQSLTPAHATQYEVLFCDRLRVLGFWEAAREALLWLPRTPGVSYVLARLWLDECRYEDAVTIFESLAGSFGPTSGLTLEDRTALASVLPGSELSDSTFRFYIHVAELFKNASALNHEVYFSQLALSVSPSTIDSTWLWHIVVKGLSELGLYDDAYTALVSCPYDSLRKECVSQLVYRMCEERTVDQLMSYNFAGLAEEVEESLSFKARNADPRVRPFYSRILYTWYVSRGDYRSAACVMYQRARKLGTLKYRPDEFMAIADLQLEAYAISMNALSLLDSKSAYFYLPVTAESRSEPRKRRKLTRHIPDNKFSSGKRDVELVEITDIRYEYALQAAQIEVAKLDLQWAAAGELLLTPSSIVMKLAHLNRFNTALTTAKSLNEDMSEVFAHLTNQCLRLSQDSNYLLSQDTSDWLLTDKVSSWTGTYADRAWRYLRQSLECHDGPQTDYAYYKTTLETILAFNRSSAPPWLIQTLEEHHPEFLIRLCLRYDVLEVALEHALSLTRKSNSQLVQQKPTAPASTWLPYMLIDQVVAAAEDQKDLSAQGLTLLGELKNEISNRLKRIHKLSEISSH